MGLRDVRWSDEALRRLARSLGSARDITGLARLTGQLVADTFLLPFGDRAFFLKRCRSDGDRAVLEFEDLSLVFENPSIVA